mmetsp:Transcript_29900/g.27370  ORF Transcript_29900/g.27370 Transcript_29900/m.27370 type:complete len:91 (+) Transcript_29900:1093-1365(+)|eukprot:CAMPEP_0114592226 /NCGR_PEP_ID=MMETSP0125-20121206/14102_1 /TAXON_ID=485358 ORGANISM="Aristerostoma sp., Strain ATCC 50986" /NCGR_SAMPLE_ID=MMETSP0125 /ASSEMBLY_ACC=CAM_ASM_000245 /LENGTH=90 /DNA_ID=CAMNT_0001790757 /DNA_START=717 /DNA_END=989 /DNA_ORIENTATION=-
MYYSNNKHVLEQKKLEYVSQVDKIMGDKVEKKEKKIKMPNGSNPLDFGLKHRGDDYYLSYMPKEVREKFKTEIDMKYILDNVRFEPRTNY